jgi:cell division protein FtsN
MPENVEIPEKPSPVNVEPVINLKATSQYYIIAGSFSEENNAKKLIDELLKKGFSAQIIDTNRNGMYRVAFLGMSNIDDAKQKLYAIREEENNPEAWILKK